MRFSLIFEAQVVDDSPRGEREVFDQLVEQSMLAEQLGFDVIWCVEHTSLTNYAHMSAPETFLAYIAGKTNRIGIGHESAGQGSLGGHNLAVLFPVWDHLFGTARHDGRYEPTGIRDQLPDEGARDYGSGFWAQQWLGLKRLVGRA